MKKKYGIFIIILTIILAGAAVTLINYFYSFAYLYNSLIRREFSINPRVEIIPDKEYKVRIWYYPFYRTVIDKDEKSFFKLVQQKISKKYPNIKIVIGKLNFRNGFEKLQEAISTGNPPDIYFNLTDNDLLEEKLQIPVNQYIKSGEQEGFYTVNWNQVNYRDQLWGWPLFVQKQYWVTRNAKINQQNFTDTIKKLDNSTLFLNYHDLLLLKQLLSVAGLNTFKLEKDKLDIDSYRAFEEVFSFLNFLRQQEILDSDLDTMPDIFIKKLLEEEGTVIGPVNPFLANFLKKKINNIQRIELNNLVNTFVLNIFRQKRYQGDDHTRAVMEVARIITQQCSSPLATELGLKSAYIEPGENMIKPRTRKIIDINPEYRDYWESTVIPAWFDFWEKGLKVREVMRRFR